MRRRDCNAVERLRFRRRHRADDGDTVVWGTSDGDTVVWGTSCSDPSCDPVIWNAP